jgi:hypothetical protein
MKQNPISRRCFVKKTAGAAAGMIGFPYLIRSSALGLAGTVAPSNRLVMAQIGSGSMGTGDLSGLLNFSPAVQVVAICDVDDNNSANAKRMVDEKNGNSDCKPYRDYRQLLDNHSLDIVSHALPIIGMRLSLWPVPGRESIYMDKNLGTHNPRGTSHL